MSDKTVCCEKVSDMEPKYIEMPVKFLHKVDEALGAVLYFNEHSLKQEKLEEYKDISDKLTKLMSKYPL